MPLHSNASARAYPIEEERLNDITSHFILRFLSTKINNRLGFCRREEERRWFINQEISLFRYRYQHLLNAEEKIKFISTYFPQLQFVPESDLVDLMKNLLAISTLADPSYYKVTIRLFCIF